MTQLSSFTPEQIAKIISLPYKAGIWISHADDVEGETDDEREAKALESCIRAVAKLHEGQPLTSEIARQTLGSKDQWNGWMESSFHTPEEAAQVMAFFSAAASESEQKNFRAFIMEIATTVAQAAGEFGAFDDAQPEGGKFASIVKKITGGFSGVSQDDAGHPMNVSPSEDSALSQLAAALKS